MDEQEEALAQAAEENAATSESLQRPRILVEATGEDITEDVVSILDAMDWALSHGSGFLDDEEQRAVDRLTRLLRFSGYFRCHEDAYLPDGKPSRILRIRKYRLMRCEFGDGHDGPHSFEESAGKIP